MEGEALAVVNALERTKHFILGCNDLIFAVDHQPLLKVFGDCRLRNLKEKTLGYKFKIVHIPGKQHEALDATSLHPVGPENPDKLFLQDDSPTQILSCGQGEADTKQPIADMPIKIAAAA